MSELLPPFHKVVSSTDECFRANDRIAELEAENKRISGSWYKAGQRIVVLEQKIELLMALAYTVQPTTGVDGSGITVRDVLRHVESELADFKSRHAGGGCGMGAATGKKP